MRFGVAFPTTEIGSDPAVIRDFVQTVEGLGYHYLTCIDHVVGAGTATGDFQASYTRANMFHEVLVLFGFIAAVTRRIELASAILILPQRQTALVAKQAAEIDVLSQGRLRLGVGLGWNQVEFEAQNENFTNRARRMEEQVEVLRRLWTEDLVTFRGAFHSLSDVGLNPVPIQRPIPLWFGAFELKAVQRAGRLADGWLINPRIAPGNAAADAIASFQEAARGAGRDIARLGIEGTVQTANKSPEQCAAEIADWHRLGATHVTIRTMQAGLASPQQHLDVIAKIHRALPAN